MIGIVAKLKIKEGSGSDLKPLRLNSLRELMQMKKVSSITIFSKRMIRHMSFRKYKDAAAHEAHGRA